MVKITTLPHISTSSERCVLIYVSNHTQQYRNNCFIYIRESPKYSNDLFHVLKLGITEDPTNDNLYLKRSASSFFHRDANAVVSFLSHLCAIRGDRIDADGDNETHRSWFLFSPSIGEETITQISNFITNIRLFEIPNL